MSASHKGKNRSCTLGNVYDIYASGETGFLKGRTFTPNHIYVSRSTNGGKSWTANLVYEGAPGTSFANVFPALAVDPTNGHLYAAWADEHHVYFSASSDQGTHWSAAVIVNAAPAATAIFPWVAAYNGTVDVVYGVRALPESLFSVLYRLFRDLLILTMDEWFFPIAYMAQGRK